MPSAPVDHSPSVRVAESSPVSFLEHWSDAAAGRERGRRLPYTDMSGNMNLPDPTSGSGSAATSAGAAAGRSATTQEQRPRKHQAKFPWEFQACVVVGARQQRAAKARAKEAAGGGWAKREDGAVCLTCFLFVAHLEKTTSPRR